MPYLTTDRAVCLLEGEQIVSRSGVYSFIHTYEHPASGRKVFLCGMSHVGQKDYYRVIRDCLAGCDFVLYEPISLTGRYKRRPPMGEEIEDIEDIDINEAIVFAILAYYIRLEEVFGFCGSPELTLEGKVFKEFYKRENWIHADILPDVDSEDSFEYSPSEALRKHISRLPKARRLEIFYFFASRVMRMEERTFTKRDFAWDLTALDSQKDLFKILVGSTLQKKRDRKCFEVFDSVVEQHNPGIVGIKFGVAHMPYQRRLLETRGYKLVGSKKVCCVRL